MNDNFADYVSNLIVSVLLAGSEERNEQLRQEHKKVVDKLIGKKD